MIITEAYADHLILHRSSAGLRIRQRESGALYNEAIDVTPCPYTYEETEEPIEALPEELLDIITGGEVQ